MLSAIEIIEQLNVIDYYQQVSDNWYINGISSECSELNSEHLGANSEHLSRSSEHLGVNSQHLDPNSQHLDPNSQHLDPNSQHLDTNFQHFAKSIDIAVPLLKQKYCAPRKDY